jgi:predicted ArsR family transcriptional regulator
MLDISDVVSALGDPTRRRILLGFYAYGRPRTVDEVAAEVGVHRTVAFGHLERLAGLGLLASEPRRGFRGKPAKLYRLVAGPLEVHHPPRRHTDLAALLAAALGGFGEAGETAARAAGAGFAARLPGQRLERLEPLGADYELLDDRVVACNCIFKEACDRQRPVVCSLHAGILEGALDGPRVQPLGPDGNGGCAFLLLKEEH